MQTMLEFFKEQHPKAPLKENGTPYTCPEKLGYENTIYCYFNPLNCVKCWNREIGYVLD